MATLAEYIARARGLVLAADFTGGSLAAWASSFFALAWQRRCGFIRARDRVGALREEGERRGPARWRSDLVEPLDPEVQTISLWEKRLAAAEGLAAASKAGQAWAHASDPRDARHEASGERASVDGVGWSRISRCALLDLRPPKTSSPSIQACACCSSSCALQPTPQVAPSPVAPEIRYRSPSTFDVEEVDPEALAARLAQTGA